MIMTFKGEKNKNKYGSVRSQDTDPEGRIFQTFFLSLQHFTMGWNKFWICGCHQFISLRGQEQIWTTLLSIYSLFLTFCCYTRGRNVLSMWFLAGNQGNHQNFDPSLLTNKLWDVFMGMKQKKNQSGRLKKSQFLKIANSQYFSWKFHGLVLGLVGLIDAKGIDVAQPIWLWGCAT